MLDLKVGQRIRVTQEIDRREGNWWTAIVGVVHDVKMQKTGSWYAHSKDDKLWLLRVQIRKDDGEISTLTIDPYTRVEVLSDAGVSASN